MPMLMMMLDVDGQFIHPDIVDEDDTTKKKNNNNNISNRPMYRLSIKSHRKIKKPFTSEKKGLNVKTVVVVATRVLLAVVLHVQVLHVLVQNVLPLGVVQW
jgi:hypothetical protein